jgi:hypothetical protein
MKSESDRESDTDIENETPATEDDAVAGSADTQEPGSSGSPLDGGGKEPLGNLGNQ